MCVVEGEGVGVCGCHVCGWVRCVCMYVCIRVCVWQADLT